MIDKSFLQHLRDPEFYYEQKGYDVRLAIMKVKDFKETFGDATLSLIYANPNKYIEKTKIERDFICRHHLRHAIMDLNNSFDLLLQVPWFYYRTWGFYNKGGKLRTDRLYNNIQRDKEDWVKKAERACSYEKVKKFLGNQEDTKSLGEYLCTFDSQYRYDKEKKSTVRKLANSLKHNHSIKLEEFRPNYNYNIIMENQSINTKNNDLEIKMEMFFDNVNNPKDKGLLKIKMKDRLEVDVEFASGEKFPAKDYLEDTEYISISEIYKELLSYKEALEVLSYQVVDILKDAAVIIKPLNNVKYLNITEFNIDEHFK